MNDTISRQAAIETALTYLVEYCGAAFDEDMQRMLKERLDSLPSAQQWIPCSEHLPKVREWVLCQCRAGIMDVLRLTEDGSWNKNYPHAEYMSGFVIAWMPLPDSWEGEIDE